MDKSFFKDKTVLVTGHTGFKGSWLCVMLKELGANVVGYSLYTNTLNDNYELCNLRDKIIDLRGDIKNLNNLANVFDNYKPDIVFHLAAQPLVIDSYKDPINTYESNVMGTLNVLECIRSLSKKCVGVMITTDKCYENKEQLWGYRENDRLGGYDPYSSSKACCEILINSYRNSFFNIEDYNTHNKAICSARAGNVIGGGDWSENRLIPDCIRSIENNTKIIIRNPKSIRPWQHVLEPLYGYLKLAQNLYYDPIKYSGAYNFGPELSEIKTVEEIAFQISSLMTKTDNIEILNNETFHESKMLFLDTSKSRFELSWIPVLGIDKTLKWTVDWYKYYNVEDVYEICKYQFNEYLHMVKY